MPDTPVIAPAVLEILRCPATGSRLRLQGDELVAINDETRCYRIARGVPTLLKDTE
ncbi:hypothetical protein [Nesterenkonia ebinurensis]|uniref:hypothetical protein n=1 Tax=Nesterenkonia ebinurensis TaxID=2608252 RepID=UPI00168BE778|nr:hypothetical protein [Nesterenkonia ebinurensis]